MPLDNFEGELCVAPGTLEIEGALEVEIHAENMTNPAKKAVPVRGIANAYDVRKYAEKMIKELQERSSNASGS